MAEQVVNINVYADGGVEPNNLPPGPEVPTWYWVLPDSLKWPYTIRDVAPDPCVMLFGSADDHEKRGHSATIITPEWMYFGHDLMALSEFGVHFMELTQADKAYIIKCYEGTHGNHVALTNGQGFPDRDGDQPRANFVAGTNLAYEPPKYDKNRRCGTDSVQGVEIVNSKGRTMLQTAYFKWDEKPPSGYGSEILRDSRVAWATIVYARGSVGKFPRLKGDVPYPFVCKDPPHYPLDYLEKYRGEKRSLYYVVPPSGNILERIATWVLGY